MAAKGKGKGKGQGKGSAKKFQIELSGDWKDYGPEEDSILKRAFLVGQPNCRFSLRGNSYEYDFRNFIQKNLSTGKTRKMRPPPGMMAPSEPLLPPGPMMVVSVPPGGQPSMDVPNPHNPSEMITVAIPPAAKPGSQIAVPMPAAGESVAQVAEKQRKWSTGAKVAAGTAAAVGVGALAVGGVVLGDHLSGGAVSDWAESVPALDAAGDWATGAAHDVGDWAGGAAHDVGDWAGGAAHDVGDWAGGAAHTIEGAAGDVGDWAGHAAGDAGHWLGDAAGDVQHFLVDLF